MRVVFLNQYYPPDAAPTGVMLEAVAERLVAEGHAVSVTCADGGYADRRHKTARLKTQEERLKTEDGGHDGEAGAGVRSQEPVVGETSTVSGSEPQIVRIGATRFGRGTFVGKLLDYLSYYVGVAWKLGTMRPAPERIVALTTPPYLSVLARFFSKLRGGTHAHWVMDIYPDVMVAHGMLRDGGVIHRLLAWLARWGWGGKRCAMVLTLGPCMAERLRRSLKLESPVLRPDAPFNGSAELAERLQPSAFNLSHVPLWSGAEREVPEEEVKALRAARGWADDEVVVMYSGNMGLGHRFGELFEAIRELAGSSATPSPAAAPRAMADRPNPSTLSGFSAEPRIAGEARAPEGAKGSRFRFVFFGRGRRRGEIEAFLRAHPDLPVELHDYVAEEDLAAHLRSADVHVASLDPAWTGTMLPSKLQGIFAAGRPVVFIGGEDSSMAGWVRESGAGWVVLPENVQALTSALRSALDSGLVRRMGEKAAEFGRTHFQMESNVATAAAALTRPIGENS